MQFWAGCNTASFASHCNMCITTPDIVTVVYLMPVSSCAISDGFISAACTNASINLSKRVHSALISACLNIFNFRVDWTETNCTALNINVLQLASLGAYRVVLLGGWISDRMYMRLSLILATLKLHRCILSVNSKLKLFWEYLLITPECKISMRQSRRSLALNCTNVLSFRYPQFSCSIFTLSSYNLIPKISPFGVISTVTSDFLYDIW